MRLTLEKHPTPHVRSAFVGKRVFLRPATTDDYETVLLWEERTDPQRWSQMVEPIVPLSRRLAEYQEKNGRAIDTTAADLTIVNRSDEGLVGMLAYRSLNLLNRSARLEVFGAPDSQKATGLQEALGLLVNYLFHQFNLNSVYAEVSELNRIALETFAALEFKQDGVLRQRHFFDGQYHNIFIYSLLRYETARK